MTASAGALVLVATPIGNLGDLSPRAVRELEVADVVACEDTRRTGRLLQHAGVRARKLMTVNDHTEAAAVAEVLRRLDAGERVAVVTDAGTPGISDPGERLVRAAAAAGHEVVVVPGPSAAIAALVASGLPTGRFVFEGFLPRKGSARAERLRALAAEPRTVVLYEAPHRIGRTLADLAVAFGGERRVAVARELTKLHEEVWRGTLAAGIEWAADEPPGEMVVVIDGAPEQAEVTDDDIRAALAAALARGSSARDAAAIVAEALGVGRRRAYELVNEVRDARGPG
jgi:16S rRNA (cytidine1402-2'-O)-methyltransferase